MIGVVRCTTEVVETCVTWTFTYDAGDRLETATSTDGQSHVYAYDPNGNRTSRTAGAAIEQDAVIDAQDRLLEYAGAEFTYNAMGQMTTAIGRPNGDWTYTYDVMGSLRRAQTAGTDIEYVVDSAGRRIGRRENGGAFTWWMYQGLHPIAEFDNQMRLTKVFVYGAEGHTPAYMATINAGAVTGRYRFVTDQVGSVLGLLDEQGQWVEQSTYAPFGRRTVVQAAPAALAHPFGFAGGIDEPATELVRFGARDYDPWTGRWTAKDPIRFDGGTANLYEYSGSVPHSHTDPTGLVATDSRTHALLQATWSAAKTGNWARAQALAMNTGELVAISAMKKIVLALPLVASGSESIKDAWLRGIPVPEIKPLDEPDEYGRPSCARSYPSADPCSRWRTMDNPMQTLSQCMSELGPTGAQRRSEANRCEGFHLNLYSVRNPSLVGTILCCECCNDTKSGPIIIPPSLNCRAQ